MSLPDRYLTWAAEHRWLNLIIVIPALAFAAGYLDGVLP